MADLHPYNPLSFEVESDVDPCIFKGTLLNEPTTEVLVTGGCPGADTFYVSNIFRIYVIFTINSNCNFNLRKKDHFRSTIPNLTEPKP